MDDYKYTDGKLYCEATDLDDLVKNGIGTPSYIYSRHTLETHYRRLKSVLAALKPMLCFSVKTLGNIHLLQILADMGAGFDVVSGGELYRVTKSGVSPERIVFAGVGKTDTEMKAAVEYGIGWFNVESEQEFEKLGEIAARLGKAVSVALRVNPDVWDARTPDKTTTARAGTKFGVDIADAPAFFAKYGDTSYARLEGLHIHLGSPIMAPEAYAIAVEKIITLTNELEGKGRQIRAINIGGGLPAAYGDEEVADWQSYADGIVKLLKPFVDNGGQVIVEPGRAIAANAGVLLTRVLYVKRSGGRKHVIVDAGMNTLIRPALYDAVHFAWPTRVQPSHVPPTRSQRLTLAGLEQVDVVGPICETTDYLVRDLLCPSVEPGELLCIFGAGAYGMVMASQYNAQPRPAEVLVEGESARVIRKRETYDDLIRHEVHCD